jgi:hypothetical protein
LDAASAAPPDDGIGRAVPAQRFAASWCSLALGFTASVDALADARQRLVEDSSADVVAALDQAVGASAEASAGFETVGHPRVRGGRELAGRARLAIDGLHGLLEEGREAVAGATGPDAAAGLPPGGDVDAALSDALGVVVDGDAPRLHRAIEKAPACEFLRDRA